MTESILSKSEGLTIRRIQPEDFDQIVELAVMGFGEKVAFEHKHYVSQQKQFPEGQICIEENGKVIASSSSLIVNFDEYPDHHSYKTICDEGYIRNHNPNGTHLYGIEVVVHPDHRQKKLAQRLYAARRELCQELDLKSIVIGGRMPYYHKYADQYSAFDYANEVIKDNLYDPVLTFQKKNGFVLKDVIHNYIPDDYESKTYATLMEWKNPGK